MQGVGSVDDTISLGERIPVLFIYFSHSVQPESLGLNKYKKNITYEFNKKKEGGKPKGKNICINRTVLINIKVHTDIYKAFLDVMNGKYYPSPKLILKPPNEKICNTSARTACCWHP